MAVNPDVAKNKFKFSWKIKNFPTYLLMNGQTLFSPVFRIKCSEITHWRLFLSPELDRMSCGLGRMHKRDDLGAILVKYRVCIVGRRGINYFMQSNTITLDHDIRNVKLTDFLEYRLLNPERHLPSRTLRLRCQLELLVDLKTTSEWKFCDSLVKLSNDLLQLYESQEASDVILQVDGKTFYVHTFVMVSRCPWLFDVPQPGYDEMVSEDDRDPNISHRNIQKIVERLDNIILARPAEHMQSTDGGCYDVHLDPVLHAFFCFLYSGRVNDLDNNIKYRLLDFAHRHLVCSLTEKLEEAENSRSAISEIIEESTTVIFDQNSISEGDQHFFEPINQLIKIPGTQTGYLCTTFFLKTIDNEPMLCVTCRFIEREFPFTLKIQILVLEGDLKNFIEEIVTISTPTDTWSPTINIKYLPSKGICLKCIFYVRILKTERTVRTGFLLPATDNLDQRSLAKLSTDFFNAMMEPGSFNPFDLTLIAQGKALKAHRQIVFARIPVFKDQLLPKMLQDHMIYHQVHQTEFEVLVRLIKYAYTGRIFSTDSGEIRKLRATAERLHVTDLVTKCDSLLQEQITRN